MARTELARSRRRGVSRRRRQSRRGAPSSRTRAERRAAVSRRRSVVALLASFAVAVVILVAWFPAGALIDQHRTLGKTSSTLTQLKQEDRALNLESKNLSRSSEIARIARQQFQLVVPGEQAYQVLPPAGTNGGPTDPYSGDPGLSAPVSPSVAPELPPGSLSSEQPAATASKAKATGSSHAAAASSPDLITRVLHTLEFWR
ncbi:MAG TPA: septum formation initiator family protein [Acidimicrobiales bacterium]|nr:septum formation initiator family protein [Acidimicrobiales bacterium]